MLKESPELEAMALAIIEAFPETFEHLVEAEIGYLFTEEEIFSKGTRKSAYAIMPTAMGQNRKLYTWALEKAFGFLPDALIVADREIWEDLTVAQKVALVYHELRHVAHAHSKAGEPRYSEEDGRPILEIVDHDISEFLDVADVFGAWHEGLEAFGKALGGKADQDKINEVMKIMAQGKNE
jgi:predicted metallopeptidase